MGYYGPNPLSPMEIQAWLDLYGIDDIEDKIEAVQFITMLDIYWLSWVQTKKDKKNANTTSSH